MDETVVGLDFFGLAQDAQLSKLKPKEISINKSITPKNMFKKDTNFLIKQHDIVNNKRYMTGLEL